VIKADEARAQADLVVLIEMVIHVAGIRAGSDRRAP